MACAQGTGRDRKKLALSLSMTISRPGILVRTISTTTLGAITIRRLRTEHLLRLMRASTMHIRKQIKAGAELARSRTNFSVRDRGATILTPRLLKGGGGSDASSEAYSRGATRHAF